MTRRHTDTVEIRIPSKLRYLGLVDAVVQCFGSELGWGRDDVNNLSTSAIEAASNAMEHGNLFAEDKSVLLRMVADGRGIVIEIEDEGSGFDPRPFERELSAEDMLKLRGRGIFIMRSFMDDVRFSRLSNNGMKVSLRKVGKPAEKESGSSAGGS
jgi:serine/threonine-protein kinase RsbW